MSPLPDYPHEDLLKTVERLLERYAQEHPEVINHVQAPARVFVPGDAVWEDPATGSAALGLGVWLVSAGVLPADGTSSYQVHQGVGQRAAVAEVNRAGDQDAVRLPQPGLQLVGPPGRLGGREEQGLELTNSVGSHGCLLRRGRVGGPGAVILGGGERGGAGRSA